MKLDTDIRIINPGHLHPAPSTVVTASYQLPFATPVLRSVPSYTLLRDKWMVRRVSRAKTLDLRAKENDDGQQEYNLSVV
jgi:hypothetical protein